MYACICLVFFFDYVFSACLFSKGREKEKIWSRVDEKVEWIWEDLEGSGGEGTMSRIYCLKKLF